MCSTNPRIVLGLYRSRHERAPLETAHSLNIDTLDTAFNYCGFRSHRILRQVASDLLGEFDISTKVGFFPGENGRHSEHDLNPRRLRDAIEVSVHDLDRAVTVVFLHNPEQSIASMTPHEGRARLVAACAELSAATAAGLSERWGISTWHPQPLVDALVDTDRNEILDPSVLMLRAGLLVGANVLDAGEKLSAWLGLNADQRWGMSPFGGNARDPIWDAVDAHRLFMRAGQRCSRHQAAVRIAAELPRVNSIVVGSDSPVHLRELVEASTMKPNPHAILAYRALLHAKTSTIAKRPTV